MCFLFFKQKTAYEMRISDWSSDVCSSDLPSGTASAPPGQKSFCTSVTISTSSGRSVREVAMPGSVRVGTTPNTMEPGWGCDGDGQFIPYELGRGSCRERVCQ